MEDFEIIQDTKKEKPKKRRRTKAVVLSIIVGLLFICICIVPPALFFGAIFSPGYNTIMYKTLSNPVFYQTRMFFVEKMTAYDSLNVVYDSSDNFPDDVDTIILEGKYISFVPSVTYNEPLRVKVVGENVNLLLKSGFFKDYNFVDYIEVSFANFIYMDTEYFYVAGLSYQDKEYIDFEVGLKNIIALMDENRSIL